MRAAIQQSGESTAAIARQYGLSPSTVMKWRRRNFTHDVSSARHNNLSSISELEEYLLVSLRTESLVNIRPAVNQALNFGDLALFRRPMQRRQKVVQKLGKVAPEFGHGGVPVVC
ncbi:MAG: helix-turn-helix domain-containing protein [Gammaproteobacteria bacterium]